MSVTFVGSPNAPTVTSVAGGANVLSPAWSGTQPRTVGDILVMCVSAGNATSVTIPSAPAGWTTGLAIGNSGSPNSMAAIYWKLAAGGDAAPSVTITCGANAAGCSATLVELAGAGPPDVTGSFVVGTAGTVTSISTPTSANVTSPGELALVVTNKQQSAAATATYTPGSGFTNQESDAGTSLRSHNFIDSSVPASGGILTDAATVTSSTSTVASVVVVFGLPAKIAPNTRGRVKHTMAVKRAHAYNRISQAPPAQIRAPARNSSSRRTPPIALKRSRVKSTIVTTSAPVNPAWVPPPTWHQVKQLAPRRGKLAQWFLPIAYGPNPAQVDQPVRKSRRAAPVPRARIHASRVIPSHSAPPPDVKRKLVRMPTVRRVKLAQTVPIQVTTPPAFVPDTSRRKPKALPVRRAKVAQWFLPLAYGPNPPTAPDSTRRRVRVAVTARRGHSTSVPPVQATITVVFVPDSTKRRARIVLARRKTTRSLVPQGSHEGLSRGISRRRTALPTLRARGKHSTAVPKQLNPPIILRPARNSSLKVALAKLNRVRRGFIALGAAPFAHPPLQLGGTAADHIINGTAAITAFNGTLAVMSINGSESTLIYNGTALVVDPHRNGTVSVSAINGTVTETSYNATEVFWGMIAANLTLGEFDDSSVNLAFTTTGGGALDLTSATVDVYLKTAAGVLDTDATTKHYSSTGGSPAITITSPTGGLATVQIPHADIVNASLAFWKATVTIGGLRNTAMFGTVTTTLL